MKESLLLYLFLLTSMVATAMDTDGIWIRRTEKLGSTASSSQMSKLTIPPKFQRSSSLAGQIILEFDDPVPLEFRSSLQAAADAWGARLKNKYPMVILVCYESLGSDIAVQTDCIYYPNGGYAYPGMLYCQLFDWEPELDFLPGVITLNSTVNWDCTNAPKTEVVAAKNVYSTMLRAIATIAGFGSSVYSLTDDAPPQFGDVINITPFDNIVFSSVGERLADKSDAVALAEFVQPPSGVDIFALYDDPQYKLYAPTTFISDMSLRYLDNPDALMHYDFGLGDTRLQIDRVTSDLLNAIGWSVVPDQEVSIKCDDIDSTVSARRMLRTRSASMV